MGKDRRSACFLAMLLLTGIAFAASIAVGRFPIDWSSVADQGSMDRRVLLTLRLPRTVMGLLAGFGLGMAGSVYQMVFQNPLASPDIMGVSSGACVGAAWAILFLGGGIWTTAVSAFLGGMITVVLVLGLSGFVRRQGIAGLVLAGIAVNALTQSVLMLLKLTADPERQLAAIEFWTMGSLADVTGDKVRGIALWILLGCCGLLLLGRQIQLLALGDEDALSLGVPVAAVRWLVLLLATLVTGAVVSMVGLVSFVGLLAPHIARLLSRSSRPSTMLLSGLVGGCLLLLADMIARSAAGAEIPVSIVTSLLGAPFLFGLLCAKERENG